MALTFHDVQAARERIAPYAVKTPLLRLHALDDYLGCQVYVKAECMQVTGSFKYRGAMNKILSLTKEELGRGIVAASSGNHGKALAYAAKMLGVKATIVLPYTAAQIKVDTIAGWGAETVRCEVQERFEVAERICREAFRHKDVPVAQEERVFGPAAFLRIPHDGVFIFDRHVEHHQVHVRIAVPAHCGNAFLVRSECFDDSHRAVACGERVARAVVKRVAEQKDAVAVEFLEKCKRLPCGDGGTMNVREDECAHLISLPHAGR